MNSRRYRYVLGAAMAACFIGATGLAIGLAYAYGESVGKSLKYKEYLSDAGSDGNSHPFGASAGEGIVRRHSAITLSAMLKTAPLHMDETGIDDSATLGRPDDGRPNLFESRTESDDDHSSPPSGSSNYLLDGMLAWGAGASFAPNSESATGATVETQVIPVNEALTTIGGVSISCAGCTEDVPTPDLGSEPAYGQLPPTADDLPLIDCFLCDQESPGDDRPTTPPTTLVLAGPKTQPIPEPATLWLVVTVLFCLIPLRGRRRLSY